MDKEFFNLTIGRGCLLHFIGRLLHMCISVR